MFKMTCYKDNITRHGKEAHVGVNIYGRWEQRMIDFVKRQHRIHKWLKGMIMVPAILILKKVVGKYLDKEVPQEPQFKKLSIIEKAFDQAILDWVQHMLMRTRKREGQTIESRMEGNQSIECLRTLKQLVMTVAINDTAYMELLNFFAMRLTFYMNTEYGENIDHTIYCSRYVNDVRYFAIAHSTQLELDLGDRKVLFTPQMLNEALRKELKRYRIQKQNEAGTAKTETKPQ